MVWRFVTISCRRRCNLSSAIVQSVRCTCCGWRLRSATALSMLATLLLAMIICSVVEAVSMENHPAEHETDSSHHDEATSCCTLLRFTLCESSSDRYRTQSYHHLTCQKLCVAVCSPRISTEPQTQLRSLWNRGPPLCLQIEPSVTPCGVRGPPGCFFVYGDFFLKGRCVVISAESHSFPIVSNFQEISDENYCINYRSARCRRLVRGL